MWKAIFHKPTQISEWRGHGTSDCLSELRESALPTVSYWA